MPNCPYCFPGHFGGSFVWCILLGLTIPVLHAQNYVVNHSFEKNKLPGTIAPCTFSKSPQVFNAVASGWQTFLSLTPDLIVRDSTQRQCFLPRPRTGSHMLGLVMYHPLQDAKHEYDYHEFVEGRLARPLTSGKWYQVGVWVWHNDSLGIVHLLQVFGRQAKVTPVACGNFGFHFSETPANPNEYFRESILNFDLRPQVNINAVVPGTGGQWVKLTRTFKATRPYKYFVFGNFSSDALTPTNLSQAEHERIDQKNNENKGAFWEKEKRVGYYLFDDFSVIETTEPLSNIAQTLQTTREYTLPEQLLFAPGRAELRPEAFAELNELAAYLLEHPQLHMEIGGHTDTDGSATANQRLSEQRADVVVRYLIEQKVPAAQLTAQGYGETQPTADNATAEGKQRNRRVACRVLDK
jgi:outer membrane protein OmpA-like peptidoglycan-associated protein